MNLVDEIFNVQVENLADYKSAKNKLRKLATIADRIYKKAVEDAKGTPEQQEKQIETAKREREEIV